MVDAHASAAASSRPTAGAIVTSLAGVALIGAAGVSAQSTLHLSDAYAATAVLLFAIVMAIAVSSLGGRHPFSSFGAANVITTGRMGAVALVAALIGEGTHREAAVAAVALSTLISIFDGLDGWIARRSAMASAFGARFDMEVDALLIAALAVLTWQHGKAGPWIIASGLLRYLFVASAWVWPWMARPLPPSLRRKTICVVQIAALIVVLLPDVQPPASSMAAAFSLAALTWSFGVDVRFLSRSDRSGRSNRSARS